MPRLVRLLVCTVFLVLASSASASAVTLTVNVAGAGTGSVSVSGHPSCTTAEGSCTYTLNSSGQTSLQATADSGSIFSGYQGCILGNGAACVVLPFFDQTITATFTPDGPTLRVALSGQGDGTVTSDPAGIDCGTDCSESYSATTDVTLTAAPDTASEFTGWSGACTGLDPCTVTMDVSRNVTATFDSNELRVFKTGSGTGYVGSGEGGIDCGNDCRDHYASGTVVSLTATADAGSEFAQFYAGCSATCEVTVNGDQSETAIFVAGGPEGTHGLEADTDGSGEGFVSSVPGGINCGRSSTEPHTECLKHFEEGSSVTLYANAGQDSRFSEWDGACDDETTATCTVSMSQARYVNATFDLQPKVLTVQKTGAGTVTATDEAGYEGLTCGDDCTDDYYPGDTATLVAAPDEGQTFLGWTGCDEPPAEARADDTCTVTMDSDKTVKAQFTATLTVSKPQTGAGTVTSTPAGIDCGDDCSETYNGGTLVTLTATASGSSEFTGWSGCDNEDAFAECKVTMNGARSVQAFFEPVSTLTINVVGQGKVTSEGTTCTTASSPCKLTISGTPGLEFAAVADPGWTYAGWTGCDAPRQNQPVQNCRVRMGTDRSVTVTFTRPGSLYVSKTGTGSGTITSAPGGIDCGTDCSQPYLQGDQVTLTATPSQDDLFEYWETGACQFSSNPVCTVTVAEASTATARFSLASTLTVVVTGRGEGSGWGYVDTTKSCPKAASPCTFRVVQRSNAYPGAFPSSGSHLSEVTINGRRCAAANTFNCTFSTANDVTLGIELAKDADKKLTVTRTGPVRGTVTSGPAGIDCGLDCSHEYETGTEVQLTATSTDTADFTGWDGACAAEPSNTCTVTMSEARSVTAAFAFAMRTLTVAKSGAGAGTITADPAGIDCGDDCSEPYLRGTQVTLTATPSDGGTFEQWETGACQSSSNPVCTVTVTEAGTVTAKFEPLAEDGTLSVNLSGAGSGRVSSTPGAIDCDPGSKDNLICADDYAGGDVVTLTAAPGSGSQLAGFDNCDAQDGTSCTVTIDGDRTVTAHFVPTPPSGGGIGGPPDPEPTDDGGGGNTPEPAAGPSFTVLNRTGTHKHLDLVTTCGTLACSPSAGATLHFAGQTLGAYSAVTPRLAAKASSTVRLRTSKAVRRALRRARVAHPRARPRVRIAVAFTLSDGRTVTRRLTLRGRAR